MNPNDFIIYNFNLKALLSLSDLDLRKVAMKNKYLTASEYYKILSQFLKLAPVASEAIRKFAEDDSGIKDWRSIREIIAIFEDMGTDKYMTELCGIRDACERGDHRSSASNAEKINQKFYNLYSSIMSAKITKRSDNSPDKDTTLLSCIKLLDEEKAGQKLLVLAVDDSPAVLESVAAVLGGEYSVFKLPKPTMLENVLKQVTPDLFLLDYQMPELNGFELIPIIRNYAEYKETPIIFLTSEGTVNNITAAVSLGACDFIVKPFNPDQLKEKVKKHIVQGTDKT